MAGIIYILWMVQTGLLESGPAFLSDTFNRSCHDRISRRV